MMDPAAPADGSIYFFVAVVLALILFSCCMVCPCSHHRHPEEERNAPAAPAQLAVAVDERRRLTAAEQARSLAAEAAALDQAGRFEEAEQARTLAAAALELEQAKRLATAPAAAAAAAEQARRLAAAQIVKKKELGYFPYSAVVEGRRGRASGDGERQLVCAICLEVFVHGSTCSEVPACRHFFHRDCIGAWMKNGKSICPLCRALIVPGSERLSAAEDMV